MKIKRKRFSEEIAEAIQHKISELGLQEGDKLPSHASLAKELNVSIPSLREGLQMLTTLGVLKINHGVGTTVAKPSVSDYFQILNSLLNSKPRAREECLEVRRQLEPWIAGKLAKKGGSYPHLQDSIKRLEEAAADHDIEAFINEYLTFHGRLCRLAGNSVIAEILNLVNRLLFSGKDLEVLVSEHTSDVIEHCRQLLKAIEKQDRNKAEEIMTAHVALLVQRPRMSIVYDTFSTGSIGGSFYSAGRELCRILNRYGGISIESEPSGGGIENVELTSEGKAILGLTQSDVAYHAFQGVAPFFKPHKQIRAVCGAHNLDLWIVARKNSGIVNIFDLQGKRIAMGATGGESVIIAKALLEAHGIHEGDYRPFYLSISNAVHSMRNSEIDLIFYLSNGPGSALAELFEEVEIRILGIDSRYLNPILKNHPYWKQSTIKQNIWSELDHDIHTLGTPTLLITHQDVPDKLIRKITAAIMEHAAEINFEYTDGSKYGIESALRGITIPLHPGAEEYYRERGLIDD